MERQTTHTVYLGLGSNIGDRHYYLHRATDEIESCVGYVFSRSSILETAPEGFVSQSLFLNQVIGVETALEVMELLSRTQEIEKILGRTTKSVGGVHYDRTCDIDILLYDDLVIREENLIIPHPRMLERSFVMKPLMEIAPDLVLPTTGKKVSEWIWDDC